MGNTYTITLERLHISRPRSPQRDTDLLTLLFCNSTKNDPLGPGEHSGYCGYVVGNLGDLSDGDYDLAQILHDRTDKLPAGSPVSITINADDTDDVYGVFTIINDGHSQDPFGKAVQAVSDAFEWVREHTDKSVHNSGDKYDPFSNGYIPSISGDISDITKLPDGAFSDDDSGFGAVMTAIVSGLWSLVDPNCDGSVVQAAWKTTGAELAAKCLGITLTKTADYEGSNSPHGCGANSRYFLTYSLQGTAPPPPPPPVIGGGGTATGTAAPATGGTGTGR